jgi:pentatricopeptide repeat protein
MDVHAKTGNIDAAFGLLDDMRAGGTEPDTIVYTSLLETCARAKDYDRAEEVFTTMKNSETGVAKPTTFSYNVLLNMYAEADNAQRVEELFTEMEPAGAIPDNRTYNILIAFHTKHQDLENAWRRYQQMREAGIHGDEHTYQLMEPLLTTHNIEHAEALFADVQKNPLTRGTNTVSMMANSLMLCYESLNKDEKILEVWHELRRLPVQPRQQSIVSVMHACTRLGLWETADTIWADVSASFNIHMYTCMAYCKVLIAQQRWDEIKPQFQKLESIFIDEALVNFLSELDQMKQHELAQEIRTLVEKHNEKAKKGNEKVRKGNERTRKAFKPR